MVFDNGVENGRSEAVKPGAGPRRGEMPDRAVRLPPAVDAELRRRNTGRLWLMLTIMIALAVTLWALVALFPAADY